ncbi:cytochrome-c oxidase, cbb3-type subunit III [Roseospirillum parvum]|uniref:Cbb3-type cytochrome c oxidase subunit n=1 Tax=Roseospirillum parvum TaxID=83401 RepID=A0A1G7WP41_9PROT|nr:cytochrome-c oxidase, cbb3-type subunit III [Roseospirillum parvum]SDG73654.1 cytochrome c oxidase cbb3-type subunit 3 [Roseospirillum parvum]
MAGGPERDAVSGRHTTGHEWDGITELNTPLPKWWVYVFFACVAWALGYVILFPSVPMPGKAASGVLGYSSRAALAENLAAAEARMGEQLAGLRQLSLEEIAADPELATFARQGGEVMFKENCVPCHQSGGAGAYGYPTLADDEWIWGGSMEAIATTIRHGVRHDEDPESRFNIMPSFGADELLSEADIDQVADYVLALSKGEASQEGPGREIFETQCAVCHSSNGEGADGAGYRDFGGPALNNRIWLYGGEKEDIVAQINQPRHGVMPAWGERLGETTIKQLTLYVHGLGGGE